MGKQIKEESLSEQSQMDESFEEEQVEDQS